MTVDWSLVVAIAMPIITLFLGAIVNHFLESRPKLVSFLGFISSHTMPPQQEGGQPIVVNTHSVVIRNAGRKAATNIRLGHNFLPNVNVYPDTEYEVRNLPGGGSELVFPTLIPKKEITISYLYFAPRIWNEVNTHIESDSGAAKVVNVLLQPETNAWVRRFTLFMLIVGLTTSGYVLFQLAEWVAT